MKIKFLILISVLFLVLFLFGCSAQNEISPLTGPYLGQKPPGKTPEIFAPGIISTGHSERNIAFTPDGRELYYGLYGAPYGVFVFRQEVNGRWSEPQIPSFSGQYQGELGISPDGNTIVFSSNQPYENSLNTTEFWIWKVEREGSGWGEAQPLGTTVNSGRFAGCPSLASSGNIYFYTERKDGMGQDDIYMSEWADGEYAESRNLGDSINTNLKEVDPAIAPDESFMIFCRREEDSGYDLFLSFKRVDGSWTPAKNMGDKINSSASEFCPSISADGKYLFFTSTRSLYPDYSESSLTYVEKMRILNSPGNGNSDIYWVDTGIIEDLKPQELK